MPKQLWDIIQSIFTREVVDYGTIHWVDFIQYVRNGSPKDRYTKLTSARFWSLGLVNLFKDADIILGDELNSFSWWDLKRYSFPKDQSIFDPIRQLWMHILTSLGLFNFVFNDYIKATNDIAPYCSTPPSPIPQTWGPLPELKFKRVNIVSRRKAIT